MHEQLCLLTNDLLTRPAAQPVENEPPEAGEDSESRPPGIRLTMPTAPRETCLFSRFLERGDERMQSAPVAFKGQARLSNEAISSLSQTHGRRLAGLHGEGEAT